jgi:hypothetical protein
MNSLWFANMEHAGLQRLRGSQIGLREELNETRQMRKFSSVFVSR